MRIHRLLSQPGFYLFISIATTLLPTLGFYPFLPFPPRSGNDVGTVEYYLNTMLLISFGATVIGFTVTVSQARRQPDIMPRWRAINYVIFFFIAAFFSFFFYLYNAFGTLIA